MNRLPRASSHIAAATRLLAPSHYPCSVDSGQQQHSRLTQRCLRPRVLSSELSLHRQCVKTDRDNLSIPSRDMTCRPRGPAQPSCRKSCSSW